jgi:hypothetical protein
MPEINLVDHSFKDYLEESEISIQISMNGFSFCIISLSDKIIRVFRSYKFQHAVMLEDILNETQAILHKDDLLNLTYKNAKTIYICRQSTIVPEEFFKPEMIKRILEFNQPIDDLDELHFNSLEQIQSKLIFTFPTYLAGMLNDQFKKISFYNQSFPLIQILSDVPSVNNDFKIAINLNREFFDMVVMKNESLRLSNNYLYVNSTDLLYFILFVCKQLGISPNASVFYFTGEQSLNTELLNGLSGYLRNIQHPVSIKEASFSFKIKQDVLSRYATLFKLALCE